MSTGTVSPQQPTVPVRHRLNTDAMTDAQLAGFRAAMSASMAIGDERGYNYQAGIHGLPLPISCDIAHGQPIFLPWHRAYLYFFELSIRGQGADVTLPWWDWTADPAIPVAYGQPTVDGAPNSLFSAKVDPIALEQGARSGDHKAPETVRFPGQPGSPPLPTAADVEAVLRLGSFVDFSHQLEQLHNNVHVWVGGDRGHPVRGVRPDLLGPPFDDRPYLAHLAAGPPAVGRAVKPARRGVAAVRDDGAADA